MTRYDPAASIAKLSHSVTGGREVIEALVESAVIVVIEEARDLTSPGR
jgi:hypothetical protein